MLLEGTPLTAGNKLGYTPPMDAVTEYTVLQNAIDAEFGHSYAQDVGYYGRQLQYSARIEF